MLSKMRFNLLVLLALFISQWSITRAVDTAYFTADKNNPLIGEPVNILLHVVMPQNAQLSLPNFANEWADISVTQVGTLNLMSQSADGEVEYTLPLTIVLWEPGSVDTPPLAMRYQIADAAPITLTIESLRFEVPTTLDPNDLTLRPSKPQISIPYFPRWIVISLITVFVVAGLFLAIRRPNWLWQSNNRYKNINTTDSSIASILNVISQISSTEKSSAKLYQQVADSLRGYIDTNLVLHSLNLTTNELMTHLKREDKLTELQHRQLTEMLKFADRMKFSQISPESKAGQQLALSAVEWIRSVEAKLEHLS